MKISVITVTNRWGGIDIAFNSLRKQTFKDFEWIIADDLYDERNLEVEAYIDGRLIVDHFKPRPKEDGQVWNLVSAYNDVLKRCHGELVISLDDYIWLPHDALERFWDDYQTYGPHLFTGVGNKAPMPPIQYPHGEITLFDVPYNQIPSGISERDTRIDGPKEVVETNHSFFELNWCAFPLSVAKAIGGFDELYQDQYCGHDRQFALRAEMNGARVYMDKANECIGLEHQSFDPRPADWEPKHYNKNPRVTLDVIEGRRPVVLNYLHND